MSQNSGNKKSNQRRKRKNQSTGANKPQQQAQSVKQSVPAESSSTSGSAPSASRRTSRKDAALAEAKKKRQMQILIGGVAAAVAVAIIFFLVNRPTNSGIEIDYTDVNIAQSGIVEGQATPPADYDATSLNFATGATVGDPDAPVTMHIFSDFQCHFCKSFHDETLPQIMDDFVRTGQVKLVYHDFPRLGTDASIADPSDMSVEINDPNNESAQAAHAAMCAGEQDMYVQMSDRIYANFSRVQGGAYSRANLDRFASDLGLDTDAFGECMDSGRYLPAIAQSVTLGQTQGVTATPMFILDNGNGAPNLIQQTANGYELIKRQIELSIETAP